MIATWFPRIFIEVYYNYKVLCRYCMEEESFSKLTLLWVYVDPHFHYSQLATWWVVARVLKFFVVFLPYGTRKEQVNRVFWPLSIILSLYMYIYIYIYIIKHRLKYFHVLERFCDYSYTYFSFLNCKINYIINFFHKGDKDLTTNNIITLFLRLQRIFSGLVDGFALGLFLADWHFIALE